MDIIFGPALLKRSFAIFLDMSSEKSTVFTALFTITDGPSGAKVPKSEIA